MALRVKTFTHGSNVFAGPVCASAKLAACRAAATRGVPDVRIADGRVPATLLAALLGESTGAWTRVK